MKSFFPPDADLLHGTLLAAGWLGIGAVLGLVYFAAVLFTARRLATGAPGLPTVGLFVARLVLMGGGLLVAALQGVVPLVAMAVGILVGRFVVMRANREPAQ